MNGFVVSWFFPPATSSEGLVTFKLLKNSSFSFDVASVGSRLWSYRSDTPLQSANIRCCELTSAGFRQWENACAERYRALAAEKKFDFLMTRAMPPQSHTAGLKIKKHAKDIFWIASMADPIGRNPYDFVRYFGSARTLLQNPLKTLARVFVYLKNRMFDAEISRKADLLIYPSLQQCRYTLGKRYEKYKDKILILPHSYDPELFPPAAQKINGGKIRISHLGHLNNLRSAEGFLRALGRLHSEDPSACSKFCVSFVGNAPENYAGVIASLGLEETVFLKQPVDYFESLRLMQESDMLLLIDALFKFPAENIFMPSKLADYFGARKPVLGLTTKNGPSGEAIRRAGCPVCRPDDIDGMCKLLKKIAREGPPPFDPAVYAEFTAETIAGRFDQTVAQKLRERH